MNSLVILRISRSSVNNRIMESFILVTAKFYFLVIIQKIKSLKQDCINKLKLSKTKAFILNHLRLKYRRINKSQSSIILGWNQNLFKK